MILQIVILISLSILILRWPYLGIAITLSSLPLTDILPNISWASSVVSALGGVTLVSFLFLQLRLKRFGLQSRFKISATLVMGFLFVLWILLSNPSAAIIPGSDGRIWIMTFIQLLVSLWLTASLFDTPKKIEILMYFFIVAAFISACVAGYQGVIGSTVNASLRALGLTEGANSAARYFLIALMFSLFLFSKQLNKIIKTLLVGAMAVLFYGILITVSRSGLLLLIVGMSLFIMRNLQRKKLSQSIIIMVIALFIVWFFADNIFVIFKGILPSITEGTDTVGVRYGLWQAGIRMWRDYPITGVGIGQFSNNLSHYGWGLLQAHYIAEKLGAHNMYIAVLSETGFVGLFFFLSLFILALLDLLKAIRSKNKDVSELAKNWLIVIILVLLAGITKQDHYEKLNWIAIGISVSISWISKRHNIVQNKAIKN